MSRMGSPHQVAEAAKRRCSRCAQEGRRMLPCSRSLPALLIGLGSALAFAGACGTSTPRRAAGAFYDPAHDLGPLFHDVHLSGIFEDSKTFADARPPLAPAETIARYSSAPGAPQINLRDFVTQQFHLPRP